MRHLSARINVPDVVVKKWILKTPKAIKIIHNLTSVATALNRSPPERLNISVALQKWEKLSQNAHRTNVSNDKFSISKFDSSHTHSPGHSPAQTDRRNVIDRCEWKFERKNAVAWMGWLITILIYFLSLLLSLPVAWGEAATNCDICYFARTSYSSSWIQDMIYEW